MEYDSKADTLEHIRQVNTYMVMSARALLFRATQHDESKLQNPEKEAFDKLTPKLKSLTYGSEEYKASLNELGEALSHHYTENSHHPEHYENGVVGMDLLDLIEMLCDWKAATLRHNDGDLAKSIEHNAKRFNIPEELKQILINTAKGKGWL